MTNTLYEIEWTESAATVRDNLDAERKEKLLLAVEVLANDPYAEPSRAMKTEGERDIRLTNYIVAEYAVLRGRIAIVMLRIFDDRTLI